MQSKQQFFALAFLLLAIPVPAYAYIDPGAGSLVVQMLIGAIATLSAMVSIYFRQLLAFLGIGKKKTVSLQPRKDETDVDA